MKARTVGVRAGTPVVVALEVVALVAFIGLPPARFGWWPAAVITAVALLLLVPTVHRRNVPGWLAAVRRWRRSRRGKYPAAAAAVDVPHGNIVCGVRVEAYEALTMIEVTGKPYSLTFLRGSTVSLTRNLLPLEVLTELLDQPGGIQLAAIDVVPAGHRVRRGNEYPPLYSTLLADRPAAGQRTMQFVVRLDIRNSVPGLQYRQSVGAAAAAATERIINALLERDIRATALTAAELDTALDRRAAAAGAGTPGHRGHRQPGRPGALSLHQPSAAAQQGQQRGWLAHHQGPPRVSHDVLLLTRGHHHRVTASDVGAAQRRGGVDAELVQTPLRGGP